MNYLHSTSGFRLVICHTFDPQEQGPSNLMLLAQRGLLLPKGTMDFRWCQSSQCTHILLVSAQSGHMDVGKTYNSNKTLPRTGL